MTYYNEIRKRDHNLDNHPSILARAPGALPVPAGRSHRRGASPPRRRWSDPSGTQAEVSLFFSGPRTALGSPNRAPLKGFGVEQIGLELIPIEVICSR